MQVYLLCRRFVLSMQLFEDQFIYTGEDSSPETVIAQAILATLLA
jgi:hypothetical protein